MPEMEQEKTPEQLKAEEEANEAVENLLAAYMGTEDPENQDPGMVVDYIIIGASTIVGPSGRSYTRTFLFNKDDSVPVYRQLGLLVYAKSHLKGILEEEDDIS